jgi:hypothetical protein
VTFGHYSTLRHVLSRGDREHVVVPLLSENLPLLKIPTSAQRQGESAGISLANLNNNPASKYNKLSIPIHHQLDAFGKSKKGRSKQPLVDTGEMPMTRKHEPTLLS